MLTIADHRADFAIPCSLTRERFWILERAGHPGLWHAVLLRIGGNVDRPMLTTALSRLWTCRPDLLLTFTVAGGHLRPGRADPPRLTEIRLTGADEDAGLERAIAEALATPFDLACGPLFRTTLIANGADHFLLLQAHAMLLSDLQLLTTVGTLAEACAGPPASCTGVDGLSQVPPGGWADDWRVRLQGRSGALHLPRRKRQRMGSPTVDSHTCEIPATVRARLEAIADERHTSLATALLAAVLSVLCRSSGQDRLSIGCAPGDVLAPPVMIDRCGEPLPIPLVASPDDSFVSRMLRTKAVLEDCASGQTPSLALLYRVLRAPAPLFETTFDFTRDRPQRWPAGAMALTYERTPPSLAPWCGMGIGFDATPERLVCRFRYRADRYDAALVRRISGELSSLLASVAADPDRPVESVATLAPDDRAALMGAWIDTSHPYPGGVTVQELIRAAARRHRDDIAVQSGEDTLSYAGLDAASDAVADRLRSAGVGPGVIVGLCMERSVHLVVGLVGIMKAGAAYLPLDPAYPVERMAFVIADAAVALVVTDGTGKVDLPAATTRLALPLAPKPPTRSTGPIASATDPAYVIYTSGSTGQPKGVLTSHRSLVNRLLWMQTHYAVTASDRFLQKTNFLFDVSVWEFLLPLISGARLVMARPGGERDPEYLHAAITEFGVTIVHFVPSALHAFLRAVPGSLPDAVRLVVASGEALPAALARDFLQRNSARLENLYGPTEAAIDVSSHSVTLDDDEPMPIGRPIWNTRLYVLDQARRPAGIGVAGELHIAGDGLAIGYLNRPELTASRFVPDPFAAEGARMYRTGDIARWNEDGELEYLGRADDQVKVNGFRIELGEIAAAAERHRHVRRAIALVVGEATSRRIILFVEARPSSATVDEQQIAQVMAERLPRYMMPAQVIPIDHLPLTSNGKLDRAALVARHLAIARSRPGDGVAADQALVDDLRSEWTRLSSTSLPGDFRDGGVTSLDAVELATMAQERYGAPLSLADVYAESTLAGVASLIRSRGGSVPQIRDTDARIKTVEGWI